LREYRHKVRKRRRSDSKLLHRDVSITHLLLRCKILVLILFISRASAISSIGINTPSPQCSCTGGEIAGIGSGTVSGTTYSWCETGGLPSGVPTEAQFQPAAQPTAQSTSQEPAPGPTQSCSIRDEVGGRGIIFGHQCICNIGPTPTATIINKEYTCPTKPPVTKRGLESFSG